MAKTFRKLTAEQEERLWDEYSSQRATTILELTSFFKQAYPNLPVPNRSTFSRLLNRRRVDPLAANRESNRVAKRRARGYYAVRVLSLIYYTSVYQTSLITTLY